MLALLLERTIERWFSAGPQPPLTAPACFEELRGCRLNLITSEQAIEPTYAATEVTQDQLAILQNIRMKALADPEEIAESIKFRRS